MSKESTAWLASVLAPRPAPPKTSDWNVQDHVDSLLARGDRDAWIINLRPAWAVQWLTAAADGRCLQRYDEQGQQSDSL